MFSLPFLKEFDLKGVRKEGPRTKERHGAGDTGALGDVIPVCAPGVPLLPGTPVQLWRHPGTPSWAGREGQGAWGTQGHRDGEGRLRISLRISLGIGLGIGLRIYEC